MITITAVPGKASQQHCEWLRPRGLEGCIIQVPPPVVKLRHSKVVVNRQQDGVHCCGFGPLTPLLRSFAGQVQAVVCWYVTDK